MKGTKPKVPKWQSRFASAKKRGVNESDGGRLASERDRRREARKPEPCDKHNPLSDQFRGAKLKAAWNDPLNWHSCDGHTFLDEGVLELYQNCTRAKCFHALGLSFERRADSPIC